MDENRSKIYKEFKRLSFWDYGYDRMYGRIVYVVELGTARSLIREINIALHEAINSPKGVVPDSALKFYDPDYEKKDLKEFECSH